MGARGVLRTIEGGHLGFHCPGCKTMHMVRVEGPNAWGWNGSYDKPTFTPSVLVRNGHHSPLHKPGDPCWCSFNAERPDEPPDFICTVCHSFVVDGQVQFLGDCTHHLANQTVALTADEGA